MLVWHFRDQEPFVDLFKFLSMLRGDFSFWSLICALMDKGILFLRQKKSARLQEWQKSEIMLVWHLSLTYSLNLNLGKCAREHFTILVCLLKQQTFFWKNQNLSYQKNIALSLSRWFRERHKKCHTNIFVNIETVPWHFF